MAIHFDEIYDEVCTIFDVIIGKLCPANSYSQRMDSEKVALIRDSALAVFSNRRQGMSFRGEGFLDIVDRTQPASFEQISARFLRTQAGKKPVLLVGAGASLESGGPLGEALMNNILRNERPTMETWEREAANLELELKNEIPTISSSWRKFVFETLRNGEDAVSLLERGTSLLPNDSKLVYSRQLRDRVYQNVISAKTPRELYNVYAPHLQDHLPSIGYQRLAEICKRGHINWIISTNFDPLVEDALSLSGISQKDIMVFYRRYSNPDFLSSWVEEEYSPPLVNLLKVHGDLTTRLVDATLESVQGFKREQVLAKSLASLLSRHDLVVAGHSLSDATINDAILDSIISNIGTTNALKSIPNLNNLVFLCESEEVIDPPKSTNRNGAAAWYRSIDNRQTLFIKFLELVFWCCGSGMIVYANPTMFAQRGRSLVVANLIDTLNSSETKSSHEFLSRKKRVTFDEAMINLDLKLREDEIQRLDGNSDPQSIGFYSTIYHLTGLSPNKHQQTNDIVMRDHANEIQGSLRDRFVDPIYLSSSADTSTFRLLEHGVRRQRNSSTDLKQMNSDWPNVHSLFVPTCTLLVRKTFFDELRERVQETVSSLADSVETVKGVEQSNPTNLRFPPGIRSLSQYLYFVQQVANAGSSDQARAIRICISPLNDKIILENETAAEAWSRLDRQSYQAAGQNVGGPAVLSRQLLETFVFLAGSSGKTIVSDVDPDCYISLHQTEREGYEAIEIRLERFFVLLQSGLALGDLIFAPEIFLDTTTERLDFPCESTVPRTPSAHKSDLIVSTGGPEHNKALELLISLHRWVGYESVFSDSNAFDRAHISTIDSGILLSTEEYVGGVQVRGAGGERLESRRSRTDWSCFISTFLVPIGDVSGLLFGDHSKVVRRGINVVAVVGLSAPGSMLGMAYVSYSKRFRVISNTNQLIKIPKLLNPRAVEIDNELPEVRDAVGTYLYYLTGGDLFEIGGVDVGDINPANEMLRYVFRAPLDTISALLNPIEPVFFEWLREMDSNTSKVFHDEFSDLQRLIDASSGEVHARLFAEIADRYLIS